MRFKAPEGCGNPVIAGVELKPGPRGIYVTGDLVAIDHMKALGFIDIDAVQALPEAPASARLPGGELRAAVLTALETLGARIVPGAPDEILAKAIREAAIAQKDVILAAVKRAEKDTEERVLKELADKGGGDKSEGKKRSA